MGCTKSNFYVNHDDYRLSHMLSAKTLPNEEILFSSTPVLMESQSSDFKKNFNFRNPAIEGEGRTLKGFPPANGNWS